MSLLDDTRACLAFWSRLPVGQAGPLPPLRTAIRALPLASIAIAAPAILGLAIASGFGLSALTAALVALAVLVVTTGAFHEDGLADCADALSAWTADRRLEIMKDSRNGTFGGLALVFSVGLRAAALSALAQSSLALACLVICAAAVVSRVLGLMPLALLPPARAEGAGRAVGPPDSDSLRIAMVGALLCAALPLLAGASAGVTVLAAIGAAASAFFATSRARVLLGGQTGDVAGAAQQMAEIAYLVVLSAAVAA